MCAFLNLHNMLACLNMHTRNMIFSHAVLVLMCRYATSPSLKTMLVKMKTNKIFILAGYKHLVYMLAMNKIRI